MNTITLRPGRERPVQHYHPWIFSGAIATVDGSPGQGDVVDVYATTGAWLARGMWSSVSQIKVRLFTWNADEALDVGLLRHRLERAIAGRARLPEARSIAETETAASNACRLVYAESDSLPGLIVDRYGAYLVIQLLTQGMAVRADHIIDLLHDLTGAHGIYERSDTETCEQEALPIAEGLRQGEIPPLITLREPGFRHCSTPRPDLQFMVNVCMGQKTGFYLDQAANRARVAAYCVDRDVLDCFCYSGGFAVHAAQAGARRVTLIDSSTTALAQAQEHWIVNNINIPIELVAGDVFKLLRQYRAEGRLFEVIILDPPKFAHKQVQVERALRGYKDINMLAMQLLSPGGVLATFSCSGRVPAELFQKVVFGAGIDARRDVQILERLTQAPDHPVLLSFPEGEYLKGLICRVW